MKPYEYSWIRKIGMPVCFRIDDTIKEGRIIDFDHYYTYVAYRQRVYVLTKLNCWPKRIPGIGPNTYNTHRKENKNMGLFESLNKGKKFDFELAEALPKEYYLKLQDLNEGDTYIVRSIYMNRKSKYGNHYVCLVEAPDGTIYGVNLPKFNNETVFGILSNDEMVAAINSGHCGIQCGELQHGENGDYFTVVWMDI